MSHWQDYTKFGFRERSRANISKSFRKQAVIDPHDEDCANTKEAWPSALCNSPCTFLVARPSVRQRTSEVQNDPQELTLAAITAHYRTPPRRATCGCSKRTKRKRQVSWKDLLPSCIMACLATIKVGSSVSTLRPVGCTMGRLPSILYWSRRI